ncbi:MAG TPA: TonB family protein [Longimicrobium sp.]|nr:TonB family protein [Longimicrobium sp.]
MRILRSSLLFAALLAAPGCAPAAAGGAESGPVSADSSAAGTVRLLQEDRARQLILREFPPLLRDAGVTGEVVMVLTLAADGSVERSIVVSSTPDHFRSAAYAVGDRLRFSPPAAAGQRVRVRLHFVPGAPRIDVESR